MLVKIRRAPTSSRILFYQNTISCSILRKLDGFILKRRIVFSRVKKAFALEQMNLLLQKKKTSSIEEDSSIVQLGRTPPPWELHLRQLAASVLSFQVEVRNTDSYVDFKMCTYLAGSYTYGSSELHFCHLRPKHGFISSTNSYISRINQAGSYSYGSSELQFCHFRPKYVLQYDIHIPTQTSKCLYTQLAATLTVARSFTFVI